MSGEITSSALLLSFKYGKHSPLCKHARSLALICSLFPLLNCRQRGQILILRLLLVILIHLIESQCGNHRKGLRKNSKDPPGFGLNRMLKSNLLVHWKVGDKMTVKHNRRWVCYSYMPEIDIFFLKWLFCLQTRCIASRATGIVHKKTTTVLCSLRFYGSSQWSERKGNQAGNFKRACWLYCISSWSPHWGCLSKNNRNGKWMSCTKRHRKNDDFTS